MALLHAPLGHQQPRYLLRKVNVFLFSTWKEFYYPCQLNAKRYECMYNLYFQQYIHPNNGWNNHWGLPSAVLPPGLLKDAGHRRTRGGVYLVSPASPDLGE